MTAPEEYTNEPQTFTVLLVLVAFCRTLAKNVRGHVWHLVTRDEYERGELDILNADRQRVFAVASKRKDRTLLDRATVGQVWEVKSTSEEAHQIYRGQSAYIGMWPDEQARTAWRLRDDAFRTSDEMVARQEKDSRWDPLVAMLDPIASEYRRLPGFERNWLLARVVSYITRTKPNK